MIHPTQNQFKTVMAFIGCALLGCMFLSTVQAQTNMETTLLRVEIQADPGEIVKISLPIGLIDTLYAVMPKEIHEACQQLELTPEIIYKELATMEGEDLVRITGKDQVRVWFEPVKEDALKDLNFVTVYVKEHNEDGNEIHVKVPKGLVKLAGRVITELGIVDECIQLPPEVRQALTRLKEKSKETK